MTDRKKVINGLCHHKEGDCDIDCPYYLDEDCSECLCGDALALLREQEPVLVKHKKVNDEYQAIDDEFVCKHCGVWWMIPEQDLKYCPGCGRAVKWDETD